MSAFTFTDGLLAPCKSSMIAVLMNMISSSVCERDEGEDGKERLEARHNVGGYDSAGFKVKECGCIR